VDYAHIRIKSTIFKVESWFGHTSTFTGSPPESCLPAPVMSFGRRLAYESLRRTNPRAGARYGDLGFGRCRSGRDQRQYHAPRLSADASLIVPLATGGIASASIKPVPNSFCSIKCKRYRWPQQGCDLQVGRAVPGYDVVLPARAVQRCWVGCVESDPPHLRGEVRRLVARGVLDLADV